MRLAIAGASLLLALGCASGGVEPPGAALAPGVAEYRIQAGDEIEVRFPLNPELDVLGFVRADGRISLKVVGELKVEGRTPAELKEELRAAYSTELRDPELSVFVRSIAARVYVDGHIERPGEYPWSPEITALQAIARAGGYRTTANEERFVVLRRGADGGQQVIQVELDDPEPGTHASRDIYLAPYDLVVVPSTGVSDVNKWVDQYIRENIPLTPRDVIPGF
jgi:protein involved in polysaccharide export with SLBB domain